MMSTDYEILNDEIVPNVFDWSEFELMNELEHDFDYQFWLQLFSLMIHSLMIHMITTSYVPN